MNLDFWAKILHRFIETLLSLSLFLFAAQTLTHQAHNLWKHSFWIFAFNKYYDADKVLWKRFSAHLIPHKIFVFALDDFQWTVLTINPKWRQPAADPVWIISTLFRMHTSEFHLFLSKTTTFSIFIHQSK